MLHKRLAGVITVKNGWAVQSVGYGRHLPLGRPEVLAENLDRWGVDEIVLQCIDRAAHGGGPDLPLLQRLSRRGLSTPLLYVGGIRHAADAVAAVQAGAERVGVDALLHDDPQAAAELAGPLGAQAVVAVMPLALDDAGSLAWLDHRSRRQQPLPGLLLEVLGSGAFSEALLVDWRHEGRPGGFDRRLPTAWPLPALPLIAFGGLGEPALTREVLGQAGVVCVAVGNMLSYREHAVQQLKHMLAGLPLRAPAYAAADAAVA